MDDWAEWCQKDPYSENHLEDDDDVEEKREEPPVSLLSFSEIPVEPTDEILAASVGNMVFALVVEKGNSWELIIYNANTGTECRPISKQKSGKESEDPSVFIDMTGKHVLLALRNGESWYFGLTSTDSGISFTKHNFSQNLRTSSGHPKSRLTAVGWDPSNQKDSSTGYILLGDSGGLIYLTRLERTEGCTSMTEVYDISKEVSRASVTGIQITRLGGAKNVAALVTTETRIYQFLGGPTLIDMFSHENHPQPIKIVPGNGDVRGGLVLHKQSPEADTGCIAWCSSGGVYHANIKWPKSSVGGCDESEPDDGEVHGVLHDGSYFSFVLDGKSYQSATANQKSVGIGGAPSTYSAAPTRHSIAPSYLRLTEKIIGISITSTLIIVMFRDRINVVSHPPGIMWRAASEPFDRIRPNELQSRTIWKHQMRGLIGIIRDPRKNQLYIVRTKILQQMGLPDSGTSNFSWKCFLQRAMLPTETDRGEYFKAAMKMCQDPRKREHIQICAAGFHFEQGNYKKTAIEYAHTYATLEECVTRLSQSGDRVALLTYLKEKVSFMKSRCMLIGQEASQLTCLLTYASKVYLDLIMAEDDTEKRELLRIEFHTFVKENEKKIPKKVLLDIIKQYNITDEALWISQLGRDYTTMMAIYMTTRNYGAAMKCLATCCNSVSSLALWYSHSPLLITVVPVQLVDAWLERPKLVPCRLIPALMKYHLDHNPPGVTAHQVIRYLRTVSRDCEEQAIHNLLFQLYCCHFESSDPLVEYLKQECRDNYHFDPKYALRLCMQEQKLPPAVLIHSFMGMHNDAVQLALEANDVQLAKEVAQQFQSHDETAKKKLWIPIAKHILKTDSTPNGSEGGVKAALGLVKEFPALSLEDILPFFGDSVIVADFQNEIMDSLTEYNLEIEDLKRQLVDMTQDAKTINEDIENVRQRTVHITGSAKCGLCSQPLLASGTFSAFGLCQHHFHQNCLRRRLFSSDSFPEDKRIRVSELLLKIREVEQAVAEGTADERDDATAVKKELDEIIGEECPLCGDMKIAEATQAFFDVDGAEHLSWAM